MPDRFTRPEAWSGTPDEATPVSAAPGTSNWLARLPDEVYLGAWELIRKHAQPGRQTTALEAAIETVRPREPRRESAPGRRALPSLLYAALTGDGERALPMTIATALLGCGVGILDDLADGDRPDNWRDYTPAEMTLAATELCCALAPLALAEVDAASAIVLEMQRALARGFLRASAGQREDLATAGQSGVSEQAAVACAAGKAGAFLAIMTTLPALLARLRAPDVAACTAFGRNLGIAISIHEDCDDLLTADWSSDLRAGTRSYPIAVYLERQGGSNRARFLELLDRARGERVAQVEVRRILRDSGIFLYSHFTVARYCEDASRMLRRVRLQEPAASVLEALVDAVPGHGGKAPERPPGKIDPEDRYVVGSVPIGRRRHADDERRYAGRIPPGPGADDNHSAAR